MEAKKVAGFLKNIKDDKLTVLKLLYYAQGIHMAIYGEPLFEEQIELWDLVPVVPEVWREWDSLDKNSKLSDGHIFYLQQVYEEFRDLSPSKLVDKTNREEPYLKLYKYGQNVVIPVDYLMNYFDKINTHTPSLINRLKEFHKDTFDRLENEARENNYPVIDCEDNKIYFQ